MNFHKEAVAAFESGSYMVGYLMMNRAAEEGNSESQHFLAKMHWDRGDGTFEMKKVAISWFQRAIENGNAQAMQQLGMIFVSGNGVDKDFKEGARLLLMAAEYGNPEGYFCLGLMYMGVQGVATDYHKAKYYLEMACQHGIIDAHSLLKHVEEALCAEIKKKNLN